MSSKGYRTTNATAKALMSKHGITQIGNAYVMTDAKGSQVVIRRSGTRWVALAMSDRRRIATTKTLTEAVEAVAA